ncbi:hypothetical protein LCGC14_1372980 [marine sediment metagenome]|uniref:Uncharacterized protein n=1 Tax=marine sediment metagenome TaxID=412755 RepID=A0A0F9K559_9ZZZZ
MLLGKHKKAIRDIVWIEMEKIKIKQHIEFEWGKKRFKLKRVK